MPLLGLRPIFTDVSHTRWCPRWHVCWGKSPPQCASSASLISERLTWSLCLARSTQNVRISGAAGLSQSSRSQSVTSFSIFSIPSGRKIDFTGILVQRVTCDLPLHPVTLDTNWKHLTDSTFWQNPYEPLHNYRMTHVTFGVLASSFAAIMAVKRNRLSILLSSILWLPKLSMTHFMLMTLWLELILPSKPLKLNHNYKGSSGFVLRKWNSSETSVLKRIPPDLLDSNFTYVISDAEEYTKTLGLEWNPKLDHFRLTVADLPPLESLYNQMFACLGHSENLWRPGMVCTHTYQSRSWQRLWEQKVDWDDPVPQTIDEAWLQWRCELSLLADKPIPGCYFPSQSKSCCFNFMASAMPLSSLTLG